MLHWALPALRTDLEGLIKIFRKLHSLGVWFSGRSHRLVAHGVPPSTGFRVGRSFRGGPLSADTDTLTCGEPVPNELGLRVTGLYRAEARHLPEDQLVSSALPAKN